MAQIDVFNGDADGICALHQLRLAEPADTELVTGVKRDIALLKRVQAGQGDLVTVLDISLDKNREPLQAMLEAGAAVRYFDHHFAGEIPEHAALDVHINTAADVCTSLLVNGYLQSAHLPWAVVGTFGDNLFESARCAAAPLGLDQEQLSLYQELGTYINYNGYGASLDDLYYPPAELFRQVQPYADPMDFIQESDTFKVLQTGFTSDMQNAANTLPTEERDQFAIYVLPDEKWARRVSGVYANQLAHDYPQRAHAILSEKSSGHFTVSVRAPLANKSGADDVCRRFETGGGRKAAAGINDLPAGEFDRLISVMAEVFSK